MHGLCGTPFVFQGEEIGMTNPQYDMNQYEDIKLKNSYQEQVKEKKLLTTKEFLDVEHKIARDNSRTPMQWDDSKNAGFSQGTPWYQVNPNYDEINVEKDRQSKKSVFKYYQDLIKLRHDEDILTEGIYEELIPNDENVFAYRRDLDNKHWLVLVNMTSKTIPMDNLKLNEVKNYSKVILHNYETQEDKQLRPYEAMILEK